MIVNYWGLSSVGRAAALQAVGQGFESPRLHQISEEARMRGTPTKGKPEAHRII